MTEERSLLLPAEVALTAVTAAMVVGFLRLFDAPSFLLPLLVTAVVAHLVTAVARRRGIGLLATAAIDVAAGLLLSAWLFELRTTMLGIPTPATLAAAGDDLADAWRLFQDVVAPAPVETGFLLASAAGIWLVAYLADWAAFRLWSTVEAVVPAATLFVFASLLGSDDHRLLATGVFLAAMLAFVLVHRAARESDTGTWIGSRSGGIASILTRGSALAAGALAVALLVGPALPGADDPAVVSWKGLDEGSGSRVTLSPMVDIRSRLVEQSDVEVFTVVSDERSYWRLTSLDTFDGTIWKSRGDYDDASGELPATLAPDLPTVRAEQRFEIEALAALWLPAAYEPRRIEDPDVDVVFEADSSTLIVGSDNVDSDGLTYRIESALPRPDPAGLTGAASELPAPIADRYLELPQDFSRDVVATAGEAVAGATTPYDRARALQDWFRSSFTYNLDVDPGHSQDAIEAFLAAREGYCEQFAGTYAAMARALGLPARVAVGFTPGEVSPDDPERFVVRGEHAHAWPEVYFPGAGWLPFEPTPGRGAPGAEAYTGVPEPEPDGGTSPTTAGPDATAPADADPGPSDTVDPDAFAGALEAGGGTSDDGGGSSALRSLAVGAAVVASLLVLYVATMAAVHRGRRAARHRHARTARQQVVAAWLDALEALAVVGLRPGLTETPREFARRVVEQGGPALAPIERLASTLTAAGYAAADPSEADVARATDDASRLDEACRSMTTTWRRLGAVLDPRTLVRPRTDRVVEDRSRVQPRPV